MKKNEHSGKFIAFEGLDGSGQSTQVETLRDLLVKKGIQVVLTKEPTKDSEAGRKVREILSKSYRAKSEELQELFVQDRKEHLENLVIPSLKDGKIVISDRYLFSTFAFGASEGLNLEWLISLNDEFLLPDLTLILKVSPEICLQRIEQRGTTRDLFEEVEKLGRVWERYKTFPNRFSNVYIIDGEQTVEKVFEEVESLVHSKLNL